MNAPRRGGWKNEGNRSHITLVGRSRSGKVGKEDLFKTEYCPGFTSPQRKGGCEGGGADVHCFCGRGHTKVKKEKKQIEKEK